MRRVAATVSLVLTSLASSCSSGIATAPSQTSASVSTGRQLIGTVIAGDSSQPISGAVVSIVSGPDAGREVSTDSGGRFTLSGSTAFDVQARAPEFDAARVSIDATQKDVQLILLPSIATYRWAGEFVNGRRMPEGVLDGFEFETHHTAVITLGLMSSCVLSGTYDDFGALIYQGDRMIVWVGIGRASTWYRQSRRLPPGGYRVVLNDGTFYGRTGCTWQLELTRPY